jgi:hypothetical protein
MKITESYPGLLYLLVFAVYLPGLVAAVRSPKLAAMPVVTFTFLGMFLFTAAGSWQVMTQMHYLVRLTSETTWVSSEAQAPWEAAPLSSCCWSRPCCSMQ